MINEITETMINGNEAVDPMLPKQNESSTSNTIAKKARLAIFLLLTATVSTGCGTVEKVKSLFGYGYSPTNTQKCLGRTKGGDLVSSVDDKKDKCVGSIEGYKDHVSDKRVRNIAVEDCMKWRNEVDSAQIVLGKQEMKYMEERAFDDRKACKIALDEMNKVSNEVEKKLSEIAAN